MTLIGAPSRSSELPGRLLKHPKGTADAAAFLDVGTPIYEVNGQPPGEQLAARFNGQIVAYRAMAPAS
jgi:hypothetical protein